MPIRKFEDSGILVKPDKLQIWVDAFHNLPVYLWSEKFSLGFFRQFLESYHEKYPDRTEIFDYLAMLDKITKENV